MVSSLPCCVTLAGMAKSEGVEALADEERSQIVSIFDSVSVDGKLQEAQVVCPVVLPTVDEN